MRKITLKPPDWKKKQLYTDVNITKASFWLVELASHALEQRHETEHKTCLHPNYSAFSKDCAIRLKSGQTESPIRVQRTDL